MIFIQDPTEARNEKIKDLLGLKKAWGQEIKDLREAGESNEKINNARLVLSDILEEIKELNKGE